MNFFGWFGAFFFSICAIPQAYKSWKEKHSDGVSSGLIIMWFLGEVCMIIYSFELSSIPLLLNYFGNLFCLLVIAFYKFGRKKG